MFYVAYAAGFLCIQNTDKGTNKTVPVVDVREATPFTTFEQADTEAKSRLFGHYAVLCTQSVSEPVDRCFTIYWRDGTKSKLEGPTVEQALTTAGYGGGATTAIDFYANDDDDSYEWVDHDWKKK